MQSTGGGLLRNRQSAVREGTVVEMRDCPELHRPSNGTKGFWTASLLIPASGCWKVWTALGCMDKRQVRKWNPARSFLHQIHFKRPYGLRAYRRAAGIVQRRCLYRYRCLARRALWAGRYSGWQADGFFHYPRGATGLYRLPWIYCKEGVTVRRCGNVM